MPSSASALRKIARGVACWVAAVALIGAASFAAFYFVFHAVFSLVAHTFKAEDDLGTVPGELVGAAVGGLAALIAACLAAFVASVPAFALIGKSGVLDRLQARRALRPTQTDNSWLDE